MKSEQSMSARAAAQLAPEPARQLAAGGAVLDPSDQAPGPYFYGGDAAGRGGYGWATGQESALFSGTDGLPAGHRKISRPN
jgi:hypothetical protein